MRCSGSRQVLATGADIRVIGMLGVAGLVVMAVAYF
jgi:hypothetical protein